MSLSKAVISVVLVAIVVVISVALVTTVDTRISDSTKTTPVKWFEDNGIDQPINWIDQPASVYFNGYTYVVWQGDVGFLPYIKRYSHTTKTWSASIKLSDTNPIAGDGHGAPSLLVTPTTGKILVAYGAHDSAIKYVRGDDDCFESPGCFVSMADLDPDATYPHFVWAGSPAKAFVWFRRTDVCAGWSYHESSDEGATFDTGTGYISLVPMYIGGITVSPDLSAIFLAGVTLEPCDGSGQPPGTRAGEVYAWYYLPDGGDQNWCKASPDDVSMGFVVDSEAELQSAGCMIENATNQNFGNIRQIGANYLADDVFVMYRTADAFGADNPWRQRFARWTGSAWSIQTVTWGDNFQDYTDFRMTSATAGEAFIPANATDSSGSKEGGNLRRWTYSSGTWTNAEAVLNASDSGGRLLSAPFIPTNASDSQRATPHTDARVFFNERIITLTDPISKMYLWGSGGFLGTELAASLSGTEATLVKILPLVVVAGIILSVVTIAIAKTRD